jgi:hypothetical protein
VKLKGQFFDILSRYLGISSSSQKSDYERSRKREDDRQARHLLKKRKTEASDQKRKVLVFESEGADGEDDIESQSAQGILHNSLISRFGEHDD